MRRIRSGCNAKHIKLLILSFKSIDNRLFGGKSYEYFITWRTE